MSLIEKNCGYSYWTYGALVEYIWKNDTFFGNIDHAIRTLQYATANRSLPPLVGNVFTLR